MRHGQTAILAALVMTASALTGIAFAHSADAAFPGRNGRLALTLTVKHGYDIFTVRPDGTGLRRLTRTHKAYDPTYSPHGRRILYNNGQQIWIMGSRGRHKMRMRILRNAWSPAWAPNGRQFAFVSRGQTHGTRLSMQVFVYRFATARTRQVTSIGLRLLLGYGAKIDHISWSPRSHRIAFTVLAFSDDLITHQAVFTVAPDGTNLQQITSWDGAGDPDWSPNGRVLVTTDGKPEDTAEPALVDRLVLRRPNGTKLRRIPVAMAADPTWSPNSHRLVYVRVFDDQPVPTPDGNLSLWFIRPDGSDRHRVVIECSRWQHQRLGGATTVDWQPLPSG